MVYIIFLIHWYIVCLYCGKKFFLPIVSWPKIHHYGFFFSCNLPKEEQAAVSLDFDHVMVSEDLCQIWCFIQNLHLQKQPTRGILKVGLSSSKKTRVICFLENPLEITKNAFYFILEAPFVLRIFKFLSWLFAHVGKMPWLE